MSTDPLSAFHEPTQLQPTPWPNQIETAPDSEPIDLEPTDLRNDVTLLRGIIGELLHAHCPDGFALNAGRLAAIIAGAGHKWDGRDRDGTYRLGIVNGS